MMKHDCNEMAILYRAAICDMANSMKVRDLVSLDERTLRTVISVRFAFALSEDEISSLESGGWPTRASEQPCAMGQATALEGEAVAR